MNIGKANWFLIVLGLFFAAIHTVPKIQHYWKYRGVDLMVTDVVRLKLGTQIFEIPAILQPLIPDSKDNITISIENIGKKGTVYYQYSQSRKTPLTEVNGFAIGRRFEQFATKNKKYRALKSVSYMTVRARSYSYVRRGPNETYRRRIVRGVPLIKRNSQGRYTLGSATLGSASSLLFGRPIQGSCSSIRDTGNYFCVMRGWHRTDISIRWQFTLFSGQENRWPQTVAAIEKLLTSAN